MIVAIRHRYNAMSNSLPAGTRMPCTRYCMEQNFDGGKFLTNQGWKMFDE